MNLIILTDKDFTSATSVRLDDYRYQHIRQVHRAAVGDVLRVGILNGKLGSATITAMDSSSVTMTIHCATAAPPAPALTLILALPRPKVLKRTLITATTLGIKRIILINSWRVDKSYWYSPALQQEQIERQLITGLEQARDTILPTVELRPRFKPFVEDELPAISASAPVYLAHPGAENPLPTPCTTPATIIIGPEGGFIPYETDLLRHHGAIPITITTRILRVETAVAVLAGRFV